MAVGMVSKAIVLFEPSVSVAVVCMDPTIMAVFCESSRGAPLCISFSRCKRLCAMVKKRRILRTRARISFVF